MGKIKRTRQKYHLSREKLTQDVPEKEDVVSNTQQSEILPSLPLPDNIFSGIDISYDNLKKSLKDSDATSINSIKTQSSTCRPIISKKEKRRLRHELFMKKLEVVHMTMKDARKRKGFKNKTSKLVPASDKLPSLILNLEDTVESSNSKKKPGKRLRSIPKVKYRKKSMLQNIAQFKVLLDRQENTRDLISSITEHVQTKVYEEAQND